MANNQANESKPARLDSYSRELLMQIEEAHSRLLELIDENDPTLPVTVTTAVPLDELLRAKVLITAERLYQTQVYLKEKVDPSIQGGVIFEAPNHKRYDASVRTQLAAVRRNLSETYLGGGQ